jgi:hypothetical protein
MDHIIKERFSANPNSELLILLDRRSQRLRFSNRVALKGA